ncbi:unnamed protein product [Clonostachys rosea f. rosea IK726]|uniref:Ketoreductase domain-containing protein n=2 Tax=Bionectria ochroleuca TaxID=29856 RepID=A0A0B7KJR7_BIOOC|nr:unnamed protein product [Clonostachys rosea f. rosea IK726]
MADLDFAGKVAVVTGAAQGLGKKCAEVLASRGASVVVHDAQARANELTRLVDAITKNGGAAVANSDSILEGDKIIQAAVAAYGTVHILIDAANITHAAWQKFRQQSYGRIINTSSAVALFGAAGQSVHSASSHSKVALTYTLAREGAKKNIFANVIVLPEEQTSLSSTATAIAYLVYQDNTKENGFVFEFSRGKAASLHRQRARGLLLRADATLTPGSILQRWHEVGNFDLSEYPSGPNKFLELQREGLKLPPNDKGVPISFQGTAVLVTGGGSGLGEAYARHFASLGASVMINDISDASSVVDDIRRSGGTAACIIASAEDGEKNVQATVNAFGRIDVVINNAGILRDKAFHNMTEDMWDKVLSVHLGATYANSRAAWPYFLRQGYGRIINTTSVTGIYGQFGQANYAAAKSAIIGLTNALAQEGSSRNILVNVIAPNAGTNMTKSILSGDVAKMFDPTHVAPLLTTLCSHLTPSTANGGLYEVGSGWFGQTRWEMLHSTTKAPLDTATGKEIAALLSGLKASTKAYPVSRKDHTQILSGQENSSLVTQKDVLGNISKAKAAISKGTRYSYTQRDLILYALSVGIPHTDLPHVFEGHQDFGALPVFGLIPFFNSQAPYEMSDIMSKYDQRLLLHVDQYLEIHSPISRSGTLTTYPTLIQVVDKGKDVVVVQGFTTVDDKKSKIFYNETTVLVRGGGGFGGDKQLQDRGAATARNEPPSRSPDHVVEEKTSEGQAALYRLNGDLNPLHIDPDFSKKGGFNTPILHGLCTLGIAGKHIYQTYGSFKSLKGKFTSAVLPGQTLRTEMWRELGKIIFQTTVVETGKRALSAAAVTLESAPSSHL